ncbi:GTP cyclohydrolase 1 type 2/Nif3 [Xylariaceae sp. FL0255]|nr:GTP cyclohydrolase 1 type 2/Nif3 [Xylariaceae sp. FL0255]
MTTAATKFRFIFRVPPHAAEQCKEAIFKEGAGRYPGPGQYTECCFSSIGTGQFRPGHTANPNIGSVGELEQVTKIRIETLCVGEDVIRSVVKALKRAHPYEEPSYEVVRLENF